MTPEYQKLREQAMRDGWEIHSWFDSSIFVEQITRIEGSRQIGAQFAYTYEEREMERCPGVILEIRWRNMLHDAERELAKERKRAAA